MDLQCTMCKHYGRCRYQQVGARECEAFQPTAEAEMKVVSDLVIEACIGTGWQLQDVVRDPAKPKAIKVGLRAQTRVAESVARDVLKKIAEHFKGVPIRSNVDIAFIMPPQGLVPPPRKIPRGW